MGSNYTGLLLHFYCTIIVVYVVDKLMNIIYKL